jgi:hypothetical protein
LYVSGILHYQDHPEVDVSGVAKHRPLYDGILFEFRGYLKAVLLVEDEYETMARSTGLVAVAVFVQQGEATGYDTIRGIESGHEGEEFFWVEETEEWRAPAVVAAEAAAEAGVAGEAVPALADGGGAREGGRLRGQAEKDVGEDVVVHVVQRRRRRKHPAFLRAHAGSGVEAAAGRRSEGRNVERE